MSRTLVSFVCALVVLATLSLQSVSAAETVGKVLAAKEALFVGSSDAKKLQSGDSIFFLDKLSTNATGMGEFVLNDGTKLALGPSASLVIDQFVQKDGSTFKKLGASVAKGTFRWISGNSPSAAYSIRTPTGTMGIQGTALEVTTLNGVTHVALLNGKAKFCEGSEGQDAARCQVLDRPCDYISTSGQGMSEKKELKDAFKSRKDAADVFPFQNDPRLLSPEFRLSGSSCFIGLALGNSGGAAPAAAAGAVGTAMAVGALGPVLLEEDEEEVSVTPN